MASKYMDMSTLKFLLYQVHQSEELFKFDRFQDYDRDAVDILLQSMKDFSDQVAYPTFREMDEDPARFEDGKIYVHPVVEKMIEAGKDLGLYNGMFSYEDGGLQMPMTVSNAMSYILDAANVNLGGYSGLTAGAASLIITYGNDELKEKYAAKMLEGAWGGTMCLTEPQAGSSLSFIKSSASPQPDGSYKIKGQKIFISGGDHEYQDNFVHLVLARIDGAPSGTKGISLFVVPKNRLTSDGNLESNDVVTAGDFQKLGQKGFCTTHLAFGESDDCTGWIVGEENRGLGYMFQMMNGARIGVGRHGASLSAAAYYASLQYANERPQGRKLVNAGEAPSQNGQTLIKNHADVRRMLLLQKAISEGALSLIMETTNYVDREMCSEGEEKEHWNMLLELLTPIVKTYPAEKGLESITAGLQILGGYGFCSEFVLQQYYRDIKIMSLYEGTTGIQSMDLLGRKMTMKNGAAVMKLSKVMQEDIAAASNYDELQPYAEKLGNQLQLMQKVMGKLVPHAMSGNYERFLMDATTFMHFMGNIIVGWQWMKMATTAKQALVTGDTTYDEEFYESKIHTMKFFYKYQLAENTAHAEILMDDEVLTIIKTNEKELVR